MEITGSVIRAFLDAHVGKTVKIITRNGYQMAGRLDAWDSKSMMVSICGVDHLVLMDNVSTVIHWGAERCGKS